MFNRVREYFQPRPVETLVCHFKTAAGVVTAIARRWAAGDEQRCRLCPRCHARAGLCLVQVRGAVGRDEAEMYSVVGLRRQSEGGAP